jgi:hypothetical protein
MAAAPALGPALCFPQGIGALVYPVISSVVHDIPGQMQKGSFWKAAKFDLRSRYRGTLNLLRGEIKLTSKALR